MPVEAVLKSLFPFSASQLPRCLEVGEWVILKTPLRMSKVQTQVLESLVFLLGNNPALESVWV